MRKKREKSDLGQRVALEVRGDVAGVLSRAIILQKMLDQGRVSRPTLPIYRKMVVK